MQRLNDRWMRLLGVPILALLGQGMMYGYTNVPYPNDWRIPLFFVLGTIVVWETNRIGILLSRRQFPELAQTWKRVLLQLVWFVIFSTLIRIAQTVVYQLVGLWHDKDTFAFKAYFFNALVSVVGTVQIAAVFEGIYLYERWKVSYTEAQELKKASLQSQLDTLKSHINPHFLFNNLNSLSALIDSDARQAERFLDEFSSVYRYLLQQQNRNLCPLADELTFIDAYFYLLKTRYGEGISLQKDIAPDYEDHLISPLTLQMLFEQIISQNIIDAGSPLLIQLYARDQMVYVESNRQPKAVAGDTGQPGLQNIIAKYRLLSQVAVLVQQNEHIVRVGIPLIAPTPVPPSLHST
ncbi:sensor histidine kinase [Salmonirosea aquatica]|uniref:Histidine kinase n=1 Tax=Salmonirosea aquatica TaxID=2654236 RepID=A0A7C9BG10_9BACT|nr:histidine kinase [Cytophagaceae bacterium SJW1-29]